MVAALAVAVPQLAACGSQSSPGGGASPSATSVGLGGTSWRATGVYNGSGAVQPVTATPRVTAVFGATGVLSGSGGCNAYSASYTVTCAGRMVIGPVAITQMACDEVTMTTEAQYTAALGRVATYAVHGDGLTLRDSTGGVQVTFSKVVGQHS
jgi:heat shock protein HslJ